MDSTEKLNILKKKFQDQKEQILKQIVRDAPMFALAAQPGIALQLIVGLRSAIEILKELDDGYEFKSEELPVNLPPKPIPDYIN